MRPGQTPEQLATFQARQLQMISDRLRSAVTRLTGDAAQGDTTAARFTHLYYTQYAHTAAAPPSPTPLAADDDADDPDFGAGPGP